MHKPVQLEMQFGEVVGVAHDAQESAAVLREYTKEANISRAQLDAMSGLPDGYSTKVLSEHPTKTLGMLSFWNIVGALGLAVAFVKDRHQAKRLQSAAKRKAAVPQTHWRTARYQACAQEIIRRTCRVGAFTRNTSLSAEERSQHARMMAHARWKAHRKRQRELRQLLNSQ